VYARRTNLARPAIDLNIRIVRSRMQRELDAPVPANGKAKAVLQFNRHYHGGLDRRRVRAKETRPFFVNGLQRTSSCAHKLAPLFRGQRVDSKVSDRPCKRFAALRATKALAFLPTIRRLPFTPLADERQEHPVHR
jgi:hypothetical protein